MNKKIITLHWNEDERISNSIIESFYNIKNFKYLWKEENMKNLYQSKSKIIQYDGKIKKTLMQLLIA